MNSLKKCKKLMVAIITLIAIIVTITTISALNAKVFGASSVDYKIQSDWGSGAVIELTINNTTSQAVDGWNVSWNFSGDQKITCLWSGDYTQNGNSVSISGVDWSSKIPANGSLNIGFQISYSGTNTIPSSFDVKFSSDDSTNANTPTSTSVITTPATTTQTTFTAPPTPSENSDKWLSILKWRDLKYGMFIHYSLSTFDGKEQTPGSTTSVGIYQPTDLDVDQWIKVAKNAGMKYAVLTSKHSSGFCLWDSKVQWKGKEFDYDVAASPVKTDVVEKFIEACNKYDILPGIYYCAMDTRHSDTSINWTPSLPYVSSEYFQLMKDHLTELHRKYPDIGVQWIDIPRHLTSGERTTLYNLVKKINPDCLVMYNYGKESSGISTYTIPVAKSVTWPTDILNSEIETISNPFQTQQEYNGTTYQLGYEHCISIVDNWFWKPNETLKSASNLKSEKNKVWELNGNLLLNVPPNKAGQIPEASIQRLNEIK
ncbi:MAG: alpha-L-fucosidase [Clostridiales bacterium]